MNGQLNYGIIYPRIQQEPMLKLIWSDVIFSASVKISRGDD